MIKFSVITCTYQAENELQRTLDSVLKQRYKEVEHLIVDDANVNLDGKENFYIYFKPSN